MLSEAYIHATEVVGHVIDQHPLPRGLHVVVLGHWRLSLNTSREVQWIEDLGALPPFALFAQHLMSPIFGTLEPFGGGVVAGMSVENFIWEMQRLTERTYEPA